MPEVIAPVALNERFTVYLNVEGKPVERTLREMTAGEALAALNWLDEECARFSEEAKPAVVIAEAIEAGRSLDDDELKHLSLDDIEAAQLACRRAGEALEKMARLTSLILARLPPHWPKRMKLGQALRRYW